MERYWFDPFFPFFFSHLDFEGNSFRSSTGAATATYDIPVVCSPQFDYFDINIKYQSDPSLSTQVRYEVEHAEGIEAVVLNQR